MLYLLKDRRGQSMLETVFLCFFLCTFLFMFIEASSLIQNKIYVQKIAREAAREAAINYQGQGIQIATNKAFGLANEFLGTQNIDISLTKDGNAVTCLIYYQKPLLTSFKNKGYGGGVMLSGKAVFPWWDRT